MDSPCAGAVDVQGSGAAVTPSSPSRDPPAPRADRRYARRDVRGLLDLLALAPGFAVTLPDDPRVRNQVMRPAKLHAYDQLKGRKGGDRG